MPKTPKVEVANDKRFRHADLAMAEVQTTPTPFLMPNGGNLVTPVNAYRRVELLLAGEQLDPGRLSTPASDRDDNSSAECLARLRLARSDRTLSPVPRERRSLQNVGEASDNQRGRQHHVLVQSVLVSRANCGTVSSCPALGRSCSRTQEPAQASGTFPSLLLNLVEFG